jgi:signal transduction histidine kinase/ActR/RegA family two-component response regulator
VEKNYNVLTLSFRNSKDEESFRERYFRNSLTKFRISFVVVILLYGVFAVLDTRVVPQYAELFHAIRFFFVIPLLGFVLACSFCQWFEKIWQMLLVICVLTGGSGIAVMTMLVPENYSYYAGMMLVFIAAYFFIRLRFMYATIAGWLVLIVYNSGALLLVSPPEVLFIDNNFFFISANLIGMFAAYNIEHSERCNFMLNKKLDHEKLQVEEINRNLEEIVTERTQDLLKALEKAQESDRLKSAFLANLSHEIRTPMNGIIGFTHLLKSSEFNNNDQHEYIEIIEKSSERLLNLINDIVDLSKIEAGLLTYNSVQTDINEQVRYIHSLFRLEAKAKQITLSCFSALNDNEAIIETDPEKLYAVLSNLVKNALKFCDGGAIKFGYTKKAGYLEFSVKDSGIGIPADRQEAIFERFIQADVSDRRAAQGAGLGLSIAKAYVELLGGKIWLYSVEGKGSTFYFTIPYVPVSRHESLAKASVNRPLEGGVSLPKDDKKITILVAEDDEVSEKLLTIILADYADSLIRACNGLEALEIFKKHNEIDLIFMDIQMPGMNGLEATRCIREISKKVMIIAQTAFGMSGDREKALAAGCNDYISKPLRKEEIVAILRKYCSSLEVY